MFNTAPAAAARLLNAALIEGALDMGEVIAVVLECNARQDWTRLHHAIRHARDGVIRITGYGDLMEAMLNDYPAELERERAEFESLLWDLPLLAE